MSPIRWRLEPYSLPLKYPFKFGNASLSERKGYFLHLESDNIRGTGELSPLGEFTGRGDDEVEESLGNLDALFSQREFSEFKEIITEAGSRQFAPEVVSGIEQALLSAVFSSGIATPDTYFGRKPSNIVKVNAIISGSSAQDYLDSAITLVKSGYTALKMKVGILPLADEIRVLEGIRERFGQEILLRLDANCLWDEKEAENRIQEYEPYSIDYIEEPLRQDRDLVHFSSSSGIRIAVDERIGSIADLSRFFSVPTIPVIILKPSLLGTLYSLLQILLPLLPSKDFVVTTALDSRTGNKKAILLAALLDNRLHHGLSTGDLFTFQPFGHFSPIKKGLLEVANTYI